MGYISYIVVVMVAIGLYLVLKTPASPEPPQLDSNLFWGPGEPPAEEDTSVRHFVINIPKNDVDDLNTRLQLPSRLAQPLEGANFTYGVNSEALEVLLKYWREDYSWRIREIKLNSLRHYKTRIEGLDIHFVRASPPPGSRKVVRPLLMLHGWPVSFVEFYDVIPLLTKPRPDSDVVFDVICPSLPGYGFSEATAKPGLSVPEIGQIMVKLMTRLGFEKFYAQGGDWGSAVATSIATLFPDSLLGVHVNMVTVTSPGGWLKAVVGAYLPSGMVVAPDQEGLLYPMQEKMGTLLRESGFMHLQATKPDTIGVALNTSPQGLAAYIFEEFSSWTKMEIIYKKDGGLLDPDFPISLDAILDNICIYWFTGSITSSMRLYAEAFDPSSTTPKVQRIPTAVPAGLLGFANDLLVLPRSLAEEKYTNIISYKLASHVGHFPAMEVPDLLATDIRSFVRAVEQLSKTI